MKDFHRFGAPKGFFHINTGSLKEISSFLGLLCRALPSWRENTEALVPAPSRLGDCGLQLEGYRWKMPRHCDLDGTLAC